MHRSQLAGFIIDCQTDDLMGAAQFWSGALGIPLRSTPIFRQMRMFGPATDYDARSV